MSEKGHGTWQEFKRAHAWVTQEHDNAGRAWFMARDLQALGHAEFAWDDDLRWVAAPPVLTMLPASGGMCFLTGARTQVLWRRLRAAGQEMDCFPEAVAERPSGPSNLFVAVASAGDAQRLAAFLGVGFTYSVAEALSAVLPDLPGLLAHATPAEFPLGFDREKLDTESLAWVAADADAEQAEPGLYRSHVWAGTEHRLVPERGQVLTCRLEAGAYEALRYDNRRVLAYDEETRTLWVPTAAGLPPLHMRAATLSSGLLPRMERDYTTWLIFDNVAPSVGNAILRTLRQSPTEEA
ncbi:hypothetical protein [Silanimonas lenta]|uniref:hypothetical protein n=1 Tax=Silanimonas lenta TaxID=265429 RepID=UPI002FE1BB6D